MEKPNRNNSLEVQQLDGNLRGRVFHIIRGSMVDGYGLRTTIFLKGCPLSCLWCCNVEGQSPVQEVKLTSELCNGCGNCKAVCLIEAIRLEPGGSPPVWVDRNRCSGCGACIEVCYTGAMESWSKDMTVDEVFEIARRDMDFYRRSGGGVSIGGGEPTFQPRFTYALIRKLKEAGIHVALDTCGYVQTELGLRCMEEVDLLLYDIKGMEPEGHLRNTGVSNRLILENLKKMSDIRKPMIIRMPLIPGYNDSLENVREAAELLGGMPSVERVDLMAYHMYGVTKYRQLEREYPLNAPTPTQDYMNEARAILERNGLRTQFGG